MSPFFLNSGESFWLAVGFVSQFVFFLRFAVQRAATKNEKRELHPGIVLVFQPCGGGRLLAYSICRSDPVFIIGLSFSFVVYLRNLYFINKKKKRALP